MKARLYRSIDLRDERGRSYRVVCRGVTVGLVLRYGRRKWEAIADGTASRVAYGFVRRGDAKRWVVQNQTEVPNDAGERS